MESARWQTASFHAAELSRWAMWLAAKGDEKHPLFADDCHESLEKCATALGYKLVKADAAAADVVISR